MSEYIRCPKCLEDTLDVDCLRCDCGYSSAAPSESPTSKQKLDAAVAERLEQLFDGSNYGSLEELQGALSDWAADLRSGAASILDYAQQDETSAELLLHKPTCMSMYASPETGRYACDCGAVKTGAGPHG